MQFAYKCSNTAEATSWVTSMWRKQLHLTASQCYCFNNCSTPILTQKYRGVLRHSCWGEGDGQVMVRWRAERGHVTLGTLLPWRVSDYEAQLPAGSWLSLVSGTLCPSVETSQRLCFSDPRPWHTGSINIVFNSQMKLKFQCKIFTKACF